MTNNGLKVCGMDDVERAIQQLQSTNNHPARFVAVAKLGTSADPRAIEPLIAALSDGDDKVRAGAAGLIHRFPRADVIPPLAQLVDDANPRVRRNAITSLIKLRFTHGFDMLLDVIQNDPDGSVKGIAIQLLADIYDERVPGVLVSLLQVTTVIGYDTRTDREFRICDCAAQTLEDKIATPEAKQIVAQWRGARSG